MKELYFKNSIYIQNYNKNGAISSSKLFGKNERTVTFLLFKYKNLCILHGAVAPRCSAPAVTTEQQAGTIHY